MPSVTASAPGKVVLSGEYVVLDGARAIAMAVNRRVRATLTPIDGNVNRIRAPGYSDIEGLFEVTEQRIKWSRGEDEYKLVDAVWREIGMDMPGAHLLVLDSQEFVDPATQQKTGIGSSAALAVALSAALKKSSDVAMIARQVHADFQSGVGSGVDIACSSRGGLIGYSLAGFQVDALRWPAGLHCRLIWTGVAVNTVVKLTRLSRRIGKASRVRLANKSDELACLWRGASAADIVSGYRSYNKILQSFSLDHDLGIFDAGHDELERVAAARGLAYKPCGAGGGDVGIVLGTNAEEVQMFVNDLPVRYVALDCEFDSQGVIIETIDGVSTGHE